MLSYLELSIAALLPAVAALILFCLERKGKFDKIPKKIKTVIYGIIFGIFAICGTEFGIPMNGAQINCRDGAVLIGGLVFGGPVGLIAGFIGGTERWIAVAWGVGTYTRVACTISTYVAGVVSALISRFMLERKKPGCGIALFIGITVEVFHMMMVFFTNIADASNAIGVVRNCSLWLIGANSMSLFIAVFLISLAAGEIKPFKFKKKSETPVFETIQRGMLTIIGICLVATCIFVYTMENNLSLNDTKSILSNGLEDASEELEDDVDSYMLEKCRMLWTDLNTNDPDDARINRLVEKYGISELFIVNEEGIVTATNAKDYLGFDMSSTEQTAEFLCLLDDETEYVQTFKTLVQDSEAMRKIAGISIDGGFLQISYDAEGIYNIVSYQIENLATNRHIGQSGSILITDQNGSIISYSKGFDDEGFKNWLNSNKNSRNYFRKTVINDVAYYYQAKSCEGYKICAFYPVSDANIQRDIMVYLTIFLIILVFMAVYVLLYLIIKKIIVDQIEKMARSLSRISSGKLDEVVDVRSNEEFASLSNDINRTVDTLKEYIAEAAARIDEELELASTIQLSALPRSEGAFPKRKDFEIYAKTDPAKEVGGDFYDFYFTGDDEMNIMIADVSDKGIPAAMFMMRAKSTLKDLTDTGYSLDQIFSEGNDSLCNGNAAEMFVTAWQGKIHLDTGLVEFVNAGHDAPLVKHADAPFVYLHQNKNLVLGAFEGVPYKLQQFQMQPGDIMLLYTDGVVEATDANQELYGNERLLKIVNSCTFTTMKEFLQSIRKDVDAFVGDAPQFDDLTMLAFRYNGENQWDAIGTAEVQS